jgi:hypothetical protein
MTADASGRITAARGIATRLSDLIAREGRTGLVWQQRFRQIAADLAVEAPAPEVLGQARERFASLYATGRNFSDYHIWRDDFAARLAANEQLSALVSQLRDLLQD